MIYRIGGMSALAICLCSPAYAQTTSSSGTAQASTASARQEAVANSNPSTGNEIIVTAQRRSESLQDVPLAVTAVTSDQLEKSGIRDMQSLASRVPNLNLGVNIGAAKVTLRGVGLENESAAAEGSIALHLDGVFLSRPVAAFGSFFDVERIEALRGPQGTLYGRNATGGSLNIITRQPTEYLSGYFNLTAGNYGTIITEGAVSDALVPETLAVRLAFQTQNRDGFGKNIVTGNDIDDLNSRAVRGSMLFTPTDRMTISLMADYYWQRDNSGGYKSPRGAGFSAPGVPIPRHAESQGGILPTDLRDVSAEDDPMSFLEFWGVLGRVSYALSDTLELSSLSAYRETRNAGRTDLDVSNLPLAPLFRVEDAAQFSQELQLSGDSSRLNWLLGLYYFYEDNEGLTAVPLNPARTIFFGPDMLTTGFLAGGFIKTEAMAAFGQATYEVTDQLSLTLGARYSTEKKTNRDELAFDLFTPFVGEFADPQQVLNRSERFSSFTPRIALDYQATPDFLLYASWSRGFKAGTFSLGAGIPPVDPETVSAFEGGIKSDLFDGRAHLNLAGFYYDYKDLQVGKVVNATLRLENAATATIYGLEAEFGVQITPQFEIDGNAAWLHARFDEYISADPARPFGDGQTLDNGVPAFNLSGNALSQAPDFAGFIGAQYIMPSSLGEFTLRGEVSYRSRVYFTPFNLDYVSQEPTTKINLFLNWVSNDDHWNGSIFVKNLTNELVIANLNVSSGVVGFPLTGYLEDPRQYGVRLGYKF